jgi:hypothetical protein
VRLHSRIAVRLIGGDMEELQEFLVFLRRHLFELLMPPVHVRLGEPRSLHDGNPLLFVQHV